MAQQPDLSRVVSDLSKLSIAEQKKVFDLLARRLAIPLRDPHEFYDDWNDRDVDMAYAETE